MGKGFSLAHAKRMAREAGTIKRLKQQVPLTTSEAAPLATDKELARFLNRAVLKALRSARKTTEFFTPEITFMAMRGFAIESFGQASLIFGHLSGKRQRLVFGRFAKNFAANFSSLSPVEQQDPVILSWTVHNSITPVFGHNPLDVRHLAGVIQEYAPLTKPVPGSLRAISHWWQTRVYQDAARRAFREGTQNRSEVQRKIVELFLRETIDPDEVIRRFNIDRKGIPKTIDAFLHETYPDFEKKPFAAQKRLREEFESNLLSTFALHLAQKEAKKMHGVHLRELEEYRTVRKEKRERFLREGDMEGVRQLDRTERLAKEEQREAGYILDLLHRPNIIRFALKQAALLFRGRLR